MQAALWSIPTGRKGAHDEIESTSELQRQLRRSIQVLRTTPGRETPPGFYQPPNGFCVSLSMDDPAEAERIFNALAENGQVNMPLQQTFWALRFGMLVDQFGIPWMVNCSDPAVI